MSSTPSGIIVLHGALGAATQMAPVVEALGAIAPARVLEFPGHGVTPRGGTPFTVNGLAAWLADGVRAAHAPPLVFGYSMGGYVALTVESRAPGTFAGIVTLGTNFAWSPERAARESARLDPAVIRAKVPRSAATLETRHAAAGGWESVLDGTAALLHALGAAPPLDAAALSRVRAPTLLAVGDGDDTVGEAETREFAAMIPGADVVVLPATPHPIEKVAAERIAGLVRRVSAG